MNIMTETSHHDSSQDNHEEFGENMALAFGKTPWQKWLDSGTDLTFTEWRERNGL